MSTAVARGDQEGAQSDVGDPRLIRFGEREECAQQSAVLQLTDGRITVVVLAIEQDVGRAPGLSFVGACAVADTSAPRQFNVGERDCAYPA